MPGSAIIALPSRVFQVWLAIRTIALSKRSCSLRQRRSQRTRNGFHRLSCTLHFLVNRRHIPAIVHPSIPSQMHQERTEHVDHIKQIFGKPEASFRRLPAYFRVQPAYSGLRFHLSTRTVTHTHHSVRHHHKPTWTLHPCQRPVLPSSRWH